MGKCLHKVLLWSHKTQDVKKEMRWGGGGGGGVGVLHWTASHSFVTQMRVLLPLSTFFTMLVPSLVTQPPPFFICCSSLRSSEF